MNGARHARRNRGPVHKLPEHREKDPTRVLRMPNQGVCAIGHVFVAGEVDPGPSPRKQRQAENDERLADRHLDDRSDSAVFQQRRP